MAEFLWAIVYLTFERKLLTMREDCSVSLENSTQNQIRLSKPIQNVSFLKKKNLAHVFDSFCCRSTNVTPMCVCGCLVPLVVAMEVPFNKVSLRVTVSL